MREWYLRNKDKVKSKTSIYEKENKKKVNLRKKVYSEKHRTKINALQLKRYHSNPEYRRKSLERAAQNRVEWRKKIFSLLGGEFCKKCGFSDYRALQIDHVNGGGTKHLKSNPKIIKPNIYFKEIQKDVSSYQVLCANCNWIKRFEGNEVPNNRK